LDTFIGYAKNLKKDNTLVLNIDDTNCMKLVPHTEAEIITFGVNGNADYKAENIYFSPDGHSTYNLNIKGKELWPIKLKVTGLHNIYNSLAAIVAANYHGVSMQLITKFIAAYSGVHRRLELKGYAEGIKIIDDYAHHPTEIEVTLKALRDSNKGNIYCIFQPHTFTRTKLLLERFASSFNNANTVIIADIYAAREADNGEIHSKDLVKAIINKGSNAIYLPTFESIEEYLIKEATPNDVIVTMGAGNVYLIGESIIEHSKKKAAV
jgi:UDP-N-acetylmuramate--alanine ligase